VQTAADLQPDWLVDAQIVGITAGTSTPDSVIDEVESCIQRFGSACLAPSRHCQLEPQIAEP
jgi:4-hydroxy-3-methylbut-2-enyl diphosphate reductase IspH